MKSSCTLLFCLLSVMAIAQIPSSGGKIKPAQANIDVKHYKISVDLDVDNHTIKGNTVIKFNVLKPTNVLEFDLVDSFHISALTVNGKKQPYDFKNNLITITTTKELPAGKSEVAVTYHGKPHVAVKPPWDDGFTYAKDAAGNPWIAVTAEATGGKLYFPCKDHPSDEPDDGAEMLITVPKGLVVAGPGLLKKVTLKGNRSTYDWVTNYSINNYSLVFNVANYKVVSRTYTSISGNKVPMQFYVLEQNAAKGEHLLDILANTVAIREKYFGEYPWIKEKIGIAETPHLGMEHQTMNAYGNQFRYVKVGNQDFDWLLNHEFGHEWWGNKVTVKDWADYWIHEGINSFADALQVEAMSGTKEYEDYFKTGSLNFANAKPIVLGKDIKEEDAYNSDIYGKGAFFMHTLRYIIGDSIFFPALKHFVLDEKYTYSNLVNTADIEGYFTQASGLDLSPIFDLYLRTNDKIEINVKRVANKGTDTTTIPAYNISLVNVNMKLTFNVVSDKGSAIVKLSKTPLYIESQTLPLIDTDMYYFKKVIYE
ncbi:MAG: M1 family metallopeptidase [Ginsengibacter sp.]